MSTVDTSRVFLYLHSNTTSCTTRSTRSKYSTTRSMAYDSGVLHRPLLYYDVLCTGVLPMILTPSDFGFHIISQ